MSCPTGSYTINTVGDIADSAFRNCDDLTSVTIGDSVTGIEENAFYSCDSLTSVTIPLEFPGSVTSLEDSAFGGCRYLKNVVP